MIVAGMRRVSIAVLIRTLRIVIITLARVRNSFCKLVLLKLLTSWNQAVLALMIDEPDRRDARHVTDDEELLRQKRDFIARSKMNLNVKRRLSRHMAERLIRTVSLPYAFCFFTIQGSTGKSGDEDAHVMCLWFSSPHAFQGVYFLFLLPLLSLLRFAHERKPKKYFCCSTLASYTQMRAELVARCI